MQAPAKMHLRVTQCWTGPRRRPAGPAGAGGWAEVPRVQRRVSQACVLEEGWSELRLEKQGRPVAELRALGPENGLLALLEHQQWALPSSLPLSSRDEGE